MSRYDYCTDDTYRPEEPGSGQETDHNSAFLKFMLDGSRQIIAEVKKGNYDSIPSKLLELDEPAGLLETLKDLKAAILVETAGGDESVSPAMDEEEL